MHAFVLIGPALVVEILRSHVKRRAACPGRTVAQTPSGGQTTPKVSPPKEAGAAWAPAEAGGGKGDFEVDVIIASRAREEVFAEGHRARDVVCIELVWPPKWEAGGKEVCRW